MRTWNKELCEDLKSIHGLDTESELQLFQSKIITETRNKKIDQIFEGEYLNYISSGFDKSMSYAQYLMENISRISQDIRIEDRNKKIDNILK